MMMNNCFNDRLAKAKSGLKLVRRRPPTAAGARALARLGPVGVRARRGLPSRALARPASCVSPSYDRSAARGTEECNLHCKLFGALVTSGPWAAAQTAFRGQLLSAVVDSANWAPSSCRRPAERLVAPSLLNEIREPHPVTFLPNPPRMRLAVYARWRIRCVLSREPISCLGAIFRYTNPLLVPLPSLAIHFNAPSASNGKRVLITDSFTINSGNNASKRRREEATAQNFKTKMCPHSLDFDESPITSPLVTSKRRILGEIQNSPVSKNPRLKSYTKISKVFEERRIFKMSNKENSYEVNKYEETTFMRYEDTRDSAYEETSMSLDSPVCRKLQKSKTIKNWTLAKLKSDSPEMMQTPNKFEETSRDSGFSNSAQKLSSPLLMDEQTIDFSEIIQSTSYDAKCEPSVSFDTRCEPSTSKKELFVPANDNVELDQDFETLHDLEEEFGSDNFDQCSKYEIISTDSPNIISRGRPSRRITSENFVFGAPISETEQSTSFNKPTFSATRILDFENLDSESPMKKPSLSVKKSLKFNSNETPIKNLLKHERSDSSIGTMSNSSPLNSTRRLKLFSSESTTSMESGFVSEMEDALLDLEEQSNSPKVANFSDLLSGQIKENLLPEKPSREIKRPLFQRSLSYNPDNSKARVSLFSILESPEKRPFKRPEPLSLEAPGSGKRRKNDAEGDRPRRPVLQRAFSENEASIMSALARSSLNPNLIGDFSLPFALPLMVGQHSDLKSISSDTLASLLRGEFEESVSDFQVIDCRYPYEFRGGHIKGAKNLYTREHVLSLMDKPVEEYTSREYPESMATAGSPGRNILVFHCEFSQERGPKLSRFLRLSDRDQNKENYPSLQYPEVYLLHQGYKAFFTKYPELCEPSGYTSMLDPKFKKDLELFRYEEKSLKKSASMDERRTLQRQKSRSRLLL
ncbi:M-phase inducer phosphatase [Eumeta japonica]|uniref:protein-tyrosine-phosphatase n=1 Tax=Eumeta variegata TaxID=151549 RepID=A0A4C1TDG1_EUMVA|nr:M-phase inducer phosphatase [Eumeta japonica]